MSDNVIKLFVGCAPNGEDAESQMVLEYTARKYSSMPIEITWMSHRNPGNNGIWQGWNSRRWATPFSGFRWAIPEACNFEGQAIYMDSDMIINADLAELWNEPWNDTAIIMMKGDWRTCVAKWNCERAKILPPVSQMKETPGSHQQLFTQLQQNPHLQQSFNRLWNNFDGENDKLEDIKILHYTDMSTQPHAKYAVPRLEAVGRKHWFDGEFRQHRRQDVIDLFDNTYNEALEAGYTVQQYIPEEDWVDYKKESQAGYRAANGFDVTQSQ